MFKEILVLYGITQAAFSYTVSNSLQMSLSELPCVFVPLKKNMLAEIASVALLLHPYKNLD